MEETNKKPITIDDLAVMVALGFEHVESEMGGIKHQMQALNSNVNNYL